MYFWHLLVYWNACRRHLLLDIHVYGFLLLTAVSDFVSLVPEDSRISKVLRRLFREEDSDKFVTLSLQLQVLIYFLVLNICSIGRMFAKSLTGDKNTFCLCVYVGLSVYLSICVLSALLHLIGLKDEILCVAGSPRTNFQLAS